MSLPTKTPTEIWRDCWCPALASRFSPVRVLGTGGRSIVIHALDSHGDSVAVKLPVTERADVRPETLRKILRREVLVLSRIAHPSIVRKLDGDESGQYLVLENLPNETLAQRWRHIRPSLEDSLSVAAQLSSALSHLHRAGFLHLDVKPRNILLRSDSPMVPVLIDFGSVRQIAKDIGFGTISAHKLGSRKYLFNAPEQLVHRTTYFTPQTDAYAVGATLYWLITGRPSFNNSALDSFKVRREHELELREALRICERLSVPKATVELVSRLLRFEMTERPENLELVAQDLERMINEYPHRHSRIPA